ncbi:hypothetical protein [Ectobacillus panaciterrae]|uniref:hypothetical protein n=1 Tax=Ectobacillus panaciterrae TaxID=363872 RepID=UPI0004236B8B|nr:hypothetical protein [Ectobacillus panaciterrae]
MIKNELIKGITGQFQNLAGEEYELDEMTVSLFTEEEIYDGQLGYSIDSEGNSLIGENEGDWKASWLVIGQDVYFGDPIFIDVLQTGCPVYTAMHGEGDWESILLSNTLHDFLVNFR